MSDKRYTAQEMRKAADFFIRNAESVRQKVLSNSVLANIHESTAMLSQAADAEDELAQLEASKERWMQYHETAAGERNACIDELREKDAEIAQLKARLEAVIKIASESHISREVKHKGLRLYVCIDDFTTDLDMGEVVKSLNSIGSILRVARGEGGAE